MKTAPRILLVLIALLTGLVGASDRARAQSSLDSSAAAEFLGDWNITIAGPDGDVPFALSLADEGGKVTATVAVVPNEGMAIENLSRSGDQLIARYNLAYEGMDLPVVMSMKREGDTLQTTWDFMEGAFTANAVGTKR